MNLPATDQLPNQSPLAQAIVGKYEVRYSATPENRVNKSHSRPPYLASWYPPQNRPPGAPQSVVVKEFGLNPTGRRGKEAEDERHANGVRRAREKGAYDIITPVQARGHGRWLLRCYGWDTRDDETWKAVFEQAGPDSMSFAHTLSGRTLQDFIDVVLLCSYDAVTELSRHGVHARDVHPGNILLPLKHISTDVPDHVILGDFDHAYLANGPITAGTSTGMGATTSRQVLVDRRHEGLIDDLFSIAATCHILLTDGQTVWLKGHLRAGYFDNHPKDWLVDNGYQIRPDTLVLNSLDPDLSLVLRGLLLDDRAKRQQAIDSASFHSALERIRSRQGKRLQDRANPKDLPESIVVQSEAAQDLSAWHIPENPQPRKRAKSALWRYDRWAAWKLAMRGISAWTFLPALLIPATVFSIIWIIWGIGHSDQTDWFSSWWSIPQTIIAAMVLPVCLMIYKRGGGRVPSPRFAASAGLGGGVFIALVLIGPRLTIQVVEEWFYSNTDLPWALDQWQLWQWGFVASITVAVCAVGALIFYRRKRGPMRIATFAVLGLAAAGLIGGALTTKIQSENTTTALGTSVSCPSPVDFGTVSRRVCLPSTSGWTVVTQSASSDAAWKSLKLGTPFVSSLDDPAATVRVALRDGKYACVTSYVLVSSQLPTPPPPAEQPGIPLLDKDDNTIKTVTLSRKTDDNKQRRALYEGNHYWHYSAEETVANGDVSSVDRYVAYAVKNGKPDNVGRYGTTRASVYVVQRGCKVADQTEIDMRIAALLGELKFGDDSSLDNVYFRSNPKQLAAAGLTLERFVVPFSEALQPAKEYTAPPLGTRGALATARLELPNSKKGVTVSLEPPQQQYAWGTPDAEYEGWTSLPVNPDDPAIPSYTFYSKLVDGPKGQLRIVVIMDTEPDPGDSGWRALKTLLDGVRLAPQDTSTPEPTSTPTPSK
ncbi:hypothetical protein [Arthrobacter sp. StoSoilB13]|uniref:hypothetical protein n=1 Tax=Arthrobacter sp. StoSoilB13 TaxID=2830993 RepID=UPI001CC5DB4C|nr:hypothetical protein [Arthrobacter sp. StoSoilB13]BCW49610.1 hypothetical protein StoSoilB13_19520 [Arthrobacter sp. StoSoilB13]